MPSKTFDVICWKSTWALIASIDSSMIIACTAGSSTSGASVATNASSSTSCTRAQAPTIETGTRIVATTMHSAERSARHQPARLRGAGGDLVGARPLPCVRSCFVLGAQRGELRLQIVDVWLGHEASSRRMSSLWRYDAASRHPTQIG